MSRPRRHVHRRDLLRLRGLGSPSKVATLPDPTEAANRDDAGVGDLLKASRPAMGSFFEVRLPARGPGVLDLADRVLDRIDDLERQLTVYRDDSELSLLNATAHLAPVAVEPGLFRLLQVADRLSLATGGAFDVTAGALSVAWGFFKGPRRVPGPETLAKARARTGRHHLRLDGSRSTVAFDRPGILINLGSIGKGHAIDEAIRVVQNYWWPTPALVHGGQSSLFALGSPPGRFGGRWSIALRNPFDPGCPLGMLRLRNRGLATSGAAFQHFEADGRVFGHILDPRTGEPCSGHAASVTVLAPTAAEADALSTAFTLLGPDASEAYIEAHPGVAAVFVADGPADGSPRITALGLEDADFQADPTLPWAVGSARPN